AVAVHADAVGPTLYYGPGAGAEPTASSVVADIIDVVRTMTVDPENRVPHLAFQPDAISTSMNILPISAIHTSYYLRMKAIDKPGVLAQVTQILAESSISIEALSQKQPAEGEKYVDVVMLTHDVTEKHLNAALSQIEQLPDIKGPVIKLRIEKL
ncbi:MAG: ACT domain-containing protein, partial [Pseudomonadota bacterium]